MLSDKTTPTAKKDPVAKLVFELAKLPGIGEKTATRLAYHIIKQDETYSRSLSDALLGAKEKIVFCQSCYTFTDQDRCITCLDTTRDQSSVCLVEKPSDVFSIESAGAHKGTYHVLHGVLSPLDGIGPEDIKIKRTALPVLNAHNGEYQRGYSCNKPKC